MIAARSERLVQSLRLTALAAVGIAALVLLWRPSLDVTLSDEAGLVTDSALLLPAAQIVRTGDAQRIAASNVFAASRRAPGRRYAPASDASAAPDAAADDPGLVFEPVQSADTPSVLGTVIDALGARALLLAPTADSLPRFYNVGDRIGSYRVRRVEAGRVTLDGPNGRIVIQLSNPNEARP